jgi:hypothetical protein
MARGGAQRSRASRVRWRWFNNVLLSQPIIMNLLKISGIDNCDIRQWRRRT